MFLVPLRLQFQNVNLVVVGLKYILLSGSQFSNVSSVKMVYYFIILMTHRHSFGDYGIRSEWFSLNMWCISTKLNKTISDTELYSYFIPGSFPVQYFGPK